MIWKNFVASFKFPERAKLIGEDYYGTKYYEKPNPSGRKSARYFVPVTKENHEQEMPAEWESWLRFRRREPPTQEEVEKNYQIAMQKKRNAKMLEGKYLNSGSTEVSKAPVEKHGFESFPSYEEYQKNGRDYKIKIPK